MIIAAIVTFVLTVILGILMLPVLKKMKIGQVVRDDGPKEHLKKTGTPTMGGIIFIIPILACTLFVGWKDPLVLASCALILVSSIVGFIDDFLKIRKKNKDGLKPIFKTIFFIVISLLYAIFIVYFTDIGSDIIIPFTNTSKIFYVPGWIYVIFIVLFYNAVINAVNFTDGVDGLCASVTSAVFIFFAVSSQIIFKNENMTYLSIIVIFAMIGYLVFNVHPAKLLMGDTGSLALGGVVTAISINLRIPWIILIVGIIYVIEILSSVIQVMHYKRTKKRIFLMAPIHHHFELMHWSENKIVIIFTAVTLAGGILAFLMI
ncbi:MAG: phospho-N-acetylmuramoyl-pentapeptide-transferase [Clostridia bacterium]|jgi:phospho-N-acetylmuramoyl-pentapeptide-transferase|nr:phospho-N-acetylmuramoyl-pentapeptide-transferase [Clostridia bacterium]MDD3092506.1 phospho-N-acetylmuramoyl-pentapeptide-transferase [Clostridia bacterium]MDD3970740.1 phospho-N-acetylmuramoyl-pentapeptide-transferase [Clostridia bacterium]MDD4542836.1 phospho-N-acetylmuramoyl-pentapeptide-transferase [Clostridia bacterium]HXK72371.1 phospho-N-acetylmuramoyl-pentapeptide-transferase [Clostridia bacterium]